MRQYGALFVLLVVAIIAASGCVEFGAIPSPTPAPAPTPTPFVMPGAIGLVPGTQVDMTLKQPIGLDRTSNMKQTENLTFTLKNGGTTNATHVYYSIKVKDGQTSDVIYTNMVSIGNITAGGTNVSVVSIPAHKFVYFITVQTTVYWGDNLEFGNELKPWYLSL